jgi:uncharacterized protein YbaR (Trm112 family)
MPADSSKTFDFDARVLAQLACPACLTGLLLDVERLVCNGCGRSYPIEGGVPVLITDRAIVGSTKDSGRA